MFLSKVLEPFRKSNLSLRGVVLLKLWRPPFSALYACSRNFSFPSNREKNLSGKSKADFERIVHDLDDKLGQNDVNDCKNTSFQQKKPLRSDNWYRCSRRRIVFLGLGLLGFGVAEYCLLSWRAKQKVGGRGTAINSIGRPRIGGPWELVNMKGELEGSEELKGNWVLIYFGFTHCPDVCPDELEKMIRIVDKLDTTERVKIPIIPVFISVDPERDTPKRVCEYCSEFSPKMKGYTGTAEQIAKVAKSFRVYYKAGPKTPSAQNDYIVDHSIMVYLMDPEGNFVDFYGQNRNEEEVIKMIKARVKEYDAKRSNMIFWFFKQ